MSERLIVKFEKGTAGPLRTAIGNLVPTHFVPVNEPPPAPTSLSLVNPEDTHRTGIPLPEPLEPTTPDWALMLADVTCDGEFDGVSPWYQIAYSAIVTIRPYRGNT